MEAALLSGFFLGGIYGLIAVGLVVVYRVSRLVNFAHGEIGMISAFLFTSMWTNAGLPRILALGIAVAVAAAASAATEIAVVRPLRSRSPLNAMVATLGVSGLLLAIAIDRYGIDIHFTRPVVTGLGIRVANLRIQNIQLVILATALVILLVLWLVDRYTAFGLRLRAVAQDAFAAGQTGINVNSTSILTWAVAGGISGLSAILISAFVPLHVFFMVPLLLRGLVAALVGGLTNVQGAFVAGILLGTLEGGVTYLTNIAGLTEVILAAAALAVLLVRPSGINQADY
jgi:branched-chain amino acid transport system permease protein